MDIEPEPMIACPICNAITAPTVPPTCTTCGRGTTDAPWFTRPDVKIDAEAMALGMMQLYEPIGVDELRMIRDRMRAGFPFNTRIEACRRADGTRAVVLRAWTPDGIYHSREIEVRP